VVRPFDIEEIFPDASAEPSRRRRRLSDSSAQGLAVTLIADYTASTRAWLPSAAIVALLGEFGVTSGAARTSISRLARRGVLEGSRQGRYSSYRLTADAAADLSNGGTAIASVGADPDTWDGSWTVIVFSMPEQESTRRRALRDHLRWSGYAPLYDGVWISPDPLPSHARAALAAAALGSVTVFRARHQELEADVDRNPVEAWDLPAIAEVMNVYRTFPVLDPGIPARLMPPDWPRGRAREVFVAIYDGLLQPAQDHVRAVVAGVTDEPYPGIRAHTVAEAAAGVRRDPH
jgi:phenylacetic acid degradation operon negative regulatory protein